MCKKIWSLVVLCVLVIVSVSGASAATPTPTVAQAASPIESVLFIGGLETSSLDYYFPMLTDSGDDPIKIASQRFTNEPSSLKDQWRRGAIGPKPGILVKEIRTGNWDVVVLQQDMTFYFDRAEEFYEYAGKFDEEIKQAGGETVLYMTWRPDPSVTTEDVAAIYNQAGADLGVKVAPVALALQRSLQERPDLPVYEEDSDPSNQLTDPAYYLMMCVLYATIFDRSPVGLSYGMTAGGTPATSHGWVFEEDIPEEVAAYLQQLAWDTVVEYRAQQETQ